MLEDATARSQRLRALFLQVALLSVLYVKLHSVLLDETRKLAQNNPDWGHAMLVPLVSAFFIWDRKKELSRLELKATWWYLAPLFFGLAIYFVSLVIRSLLLMDIAGGLSLAALVLATGGWRLLALLAFPICYLGFAMDLELFFEPISRTLQRIAVSGAAEAISATGGLMDLESWRNGNVIQLFYRGEPVNPPLNVAEACSGLRMLVSLAAAGVAMAGLLYRPWWFRLLVAFATVPIAIVVNILRITILAFLAPHYPSLSHGEFHTHAGGLVMLVPSIFMFLGFIRLLDWIVEPILAAAAAEGEASSAGEPSAADAVAIAAAAPGPGESVAKVLPLAGWRAMPTSMFLVLAVLMAAAAFAEIALTRRTEAVLARAGDAPKAPLTSLPVKIGSWERVSVRTYEGLVGQKLGTSHYIDWVYRNQDDPTRGMRLHLAYYSGNTYMLDVWHVPEVCYVGAGSTPLEAGYTDLHVSGQTVPMRRFTFSQGDSTKSASVLYTFLTNDHFVANRHGVKYRALDWRFPVPYVCKIELLEGEMVQDATGKWVLAADSAGDRAIAGAENFLTDALPLIRKLMPSAEGGADSK